MSSLARLAEHWGEVVDVDVSDRRTAYRAECQCGWRGSVRWTVPSARDDGEAHASDAATASPDPTCSDDYRTP